ncbi:hypothetical protein GM921_00415 [Pedobacter sp. LMG 31464]|uniref:Uncharacterized protein n=1 Tax=Pedobacter planticolens TaxID=2679964 RepID=A0A923DXW6_9SPHI|nr:hypothetical protein [Pedobacter planticolens]MBB2143932.1 hypothetical protein [Pedobacter planticolens]
MKNLIYILLTITLCSNCFAQDTLKDGKYTQDGKVFKITKSTYLDKTSFSVSVIGRFWDKPSPPPKNPNGFRTNKKDIHFDIIKVKKIVSDVLNGKRNDLQQNKDRIDLSFTFLQENGSIENISYFFNGNTKINLKDIAKIDKEIKKNVKATFTGNDYKNFYLIPYGMVSVVF